MKYYTVLPILMLQAVPNCGNSGGPIIVKECEVNTCPSGHKCIESTIPGGQKVCVKAPTPSPSTIPTPTPIPSASPTPIPSTPPTTTPPPTNKIEDDPRWCEKVGKNFPLPLYDPALGDVPGNTFCPTCWRDPKYADDFLAEWGISDFGRVSTPNCKTKNPPCAGYRQNLQLTPMSDEPFLPHRPDGGREMWRACQPSVMSEDVPDVWVYPPGETPGICEHFTSNRYHVHHKPNKGHTGKTKFEVRHPKGKTIILNLPAE